MSRPHSPLYSPVRLASSQPMSKRSLSSDERDSSASCSSYSTSTTSSSIPSPDDDDDPHQLEQGDPFGLEFSMSHLQLERLPSEYFPSSSLGLSESAAAAARKARTSSHTIDQDDFDEEKQPEGGYQGGHGVGSDWGRGVDAPTPRQEGGPRGDTPSGGVELDAYPFLHPTDNDNPSPPSSPSTETIQDPAPIPLPHLHLIPRPPPSPAVRKYSSGLLTATRALLQISLSPNPSPSRDTHSSYFPGDGSCEGQAPHGWGQNNPDTDDRAEPDADEGDYWSPTRSPPHDEDGAFTLEDEGSYDRRFARLRREADERAEALRALRAGAGNSAAREGGAFGTEAVVLEEGEHRPTHQSGWVAGHERSWSTDDEGLGDEGVHHVEYSGYP